MPNNITCPDAGCPLRSADSVPKFCPECGVASADVLTPPNACTLCGKDFGDTHPKFCPECGTRTPVPLNKPEGSLLDAYGLERPPHLEPGEKVYGNVDELLARHEAAKAARAAPGGSTGRGLTAVEQERMMRSLQAGAKPDRRYSEETARLTTSEREAFKEASALAVPDEETQRALKERGLGTSRPAVHNADDTWKPGGLSSRGAKLDSDYHNHVRVIPYSFRNPAHRGRERVGPGKGEEGDENASPEDEAFFRQEPGDQDAFDRLLNPKSRDS